MKIGRVLTGRAICLIRSRIIDRYGWHELRKKVIISSFNSFKHKIPPWRFFAQTQPGRIQDFFRRGCTRLLLYFNTNKPHSFFLQNTSCIRKPQVISGGRRVRNPCTLSLDPPLRKKLITHSRTFMHCYHSRAITSTDNSQSHQRTLL